MQTSSVGGSSVTLHMAVAVNPPRPAGPLVVMTLTGAQTRAMALRNSVLEKASSMVASYSAADLNWSALPIGGNQVSPVQPFSS